MAFKRNWKTAQEQATNALKAYVELTAQKRADDADRKMRLAQGYVAEAIKLDKRGPLKPE